MRPDQADGLNSMRLKKSLIDQLPPAIVNPRQWLADRIETFCISIYTLERLLKQRGYRGKRVCKSLKEQQDAVMMVFFAQELRLLKEAHRQGGGVESVVL